MNIIRFRFLLNLKKRVFFFCCLLMLLLSSGKSFTQNNPEQGLPFIANYTSKDFNALPQVWAAIEDNRNLMYFGLQGSIIEFDGVKWRKIVQSRGGPPFVVARSFAKDKKGKIYYGAD